MQVVCVGANDRRETTFRELMTGIRLFPLVRKQYEHDLGRATKFFDCSKGDSLYRTSGYLVSWSLALRFDSAVRARKKQGTLPAGI